MTRLDQRVRRIVDGVGKRGVVIALYPGGSVGVRELRCRKEYFVSVSAIWRFAVEREVERVRAEKRAKRGAKVKVSRGLLTTGRKRVK